MIISRVCAVRSPHFHKTILAGLFVASLSFGPNANAAPAVDFNRDIRPILSDNCFHCHGPDDKQRKAGLRLDLRESAVKPAESGETAIVPGKLDSSQLVKRIVAKNADDRMPPVDSGKKLNERQIELLKQWVADGAKYEGHWAFQPIRRPTLPDVKQPGWCRTPIDRFVLARLEAEGLKPSAEADRETMIRRLSLDLIGLPPTPAEIDAYVKDKSPEAYEKVVDRLLLSPHYGERMALPWLDLARYADSNGFQTDSSRQMWRWRDWVIDAFNQNKPFDQFTIEQLAGDLLPNATNQQILATGFHRNHRINGEGGRIQEEWFAETVIDRVETTGLTWMGLTFNCCRCHDHKYDPITQKEFYQMFAFFNSIDESGVIDSGGGNRGGGNSRPFLHMLSPPQEAELIKLQSDLAKAELDVAEQTAKLPASLTDWEEKIHAAGDVAKPDVTLTAAWHQLHPTDVTSQGGAAIKTLDDGSYLAEGSNPDNDTYTIKAPPLEKALTGLLLEVFPDDSLPKASLGRAANGNFVLTGVEVQVIAPKQKMPLKIVFTRAEADYEQKNWEVSSLLQPSKKGAKPPPKAGWAVDGNDVDKRLPRKAMFVTAKPVVLPAGAQLVIRLKHESQYVDHNIGRFRLSTSSLSPEALSLSGNKLPAAINAILAIDSQQRTEPQRLELQKFFRGNTDNPLHTADEQLAALKKQVEDLRDNGPTVMVMKELPKPREAHVLIRGQYDQIGDVVPRAVPTWLPPLPPGEPVNRLGLARWLVSDQHPLTSRVWVNRTWEKFFGQGICKTTENLGSQADYPSHPELLDWLAAEYRQPTVMPDVAGQKAQRWDMKAFQKMIVMSATYRQTSHVTPDGLQNDPENILLARGPRFRLQAELVRDQALAASGLISEKIGGQSVHPYMPDGVWDETSVYGDLRNYKADTGESLYRRTMYTIWKRTAAPPSQLLFDAPNREICTVKRSRTNTPLQALALLNEITYAEAARKLGERMLTEGGSSPDERLAYGFRLVSAHQPSAAELKILASGFEADLKHFRADGADAKKLIAIGRAAVNTKCDPAELAAYTVAANVLLNLDTFITRE